MKKFLLIAAIAAFLCGCNRHDAADYGELTIVNQTKDYVDVVIMQNYVHNPDLIEIHVNVNASYVLGEVPIGSYSITAKHPNGDKTYYDAYVEPFYKNTDVYINDPK